MIDYRVRSISLLNLINDIRSGRLIPDAYFQRNIVWRDVHNKDFIKTILMGYPFPQIFISKGKVNVDTMTTISCIVDGQQRTNAINRYVNNEYDVEGKYFDQLSETEKSDFLKYEIAIIELDLENDSPIVQEIFQRINRTSNSLTAIEKLASEYSTSEYMLVAKLLADQINLDIVENDESFKEDPNIPKDFYPWARRQQVKSIQHLITNKNIFNPREISRKVHLMHILNMMSTILSGFFNRNEKTLDLLNDYFNDFEQKEIIINHFERTAKIFIDLKLKAKSIWYTKSVFFSIFIIIANNLDIIERNSEGFKQNIDEFERNIPDDFRLASAEGVNNKKERQLRNDTLTQLYQNLN